MQAHSDVAVSIVSFSPWLISLLFVKEKKKQNLRKRWIFRYASVIAMESTTKVDDEQWLAYWIIYSFLSLTELILQSLIEWIPIWYTVKLVFVAWLVLPQFQGAAFIYNRVVREQFKKHGVLRSTHSKATKPNRVNSSFSFFLILRFINHSCRILQWGQIKNLFYIKINSFNIVLGNVRLCA